MRWWAIAFLLAWATTAHAGTKRVAVIVGNNAGNVGQKPLHYAETDAVKLARVLAELGGVAPSDLFVLAGRDLAALTSTLALAKRRIAEFRGDPTNRVVVLFYFSGHSDGEALELGRDRLKFSELRRWLATTGADVRVAVVDSCKSGALLAVKGGTRGPAFQIRLSDALASSGEALLTSSAADEVALESREIGGSFFTHHFISGLRGAADASGDGAVTLTEAYQYTYAHTIKTTGETVIGPQHPTYDYRLSGQGELVLAEISRPTAALDLPPGFDRMLVIDRDRDQVIAEVTAAGVIAVQPGRYGIRAWRDGKMLGGQVSVAFGERRAVHPEALAPIDSIATIGKGAELSPRWSLFLAAGGTRGVADDLGIVPAGRVELRTRSFSLALAAGSRRGTGFRESSALVLAGYRGVVEGDRGVAWLGVEAGVGIVVQTEMQPVAYSGVLAAAAVAGVSIELTPRTSLAIEATLPAILIKRDDATSLTTWPAGWIGVVVTL